MAAIDKSIHLDCVYFLLRRQPDLLVKLLPSLASTTPVAVAEIETETLDSNNTNNNNGYDSKQRKRKRGGSLKKKKRHSIPFYQLDSIPFHSFSFLFPILEYSTVTVTVTDMVWYGMVYIVIECMHA
jgi:hypothetical protein